MNIKILIMGESGTGKSTSIRTLDPKSTYIINTIDKPLPFKASNKIYFTTTKERLGNLYSIQKIEKMAQEVISCMQYINTKRPEVKTLIIDDFQYLMSYEFMQRASETGFTKFTEIAQHAWKIIKFEARNDLTIVFLTHSELDSMGQTKCKTIGKLLDEKIVIEGMFSIVLNSIYYEDSYFFLTQNESIYRSKTPFEMFDKKMIPNDLQYVIDNVNAYYQEDATIEETTEVKI